MAKVVNVLKDNLVNVLKDNRVNVQKDNLVNVLKDNRDKEEGCHHYLFCKRWTQTTMVKFPVTK